MPTLNDFHQEQCGQATLFINKGQMFTVNFSPDSTHMLERGVKEKATPKANRFLLSRNPGGCLCLLAF